MSEQVLIEHCAVHSELQAMKLTSAACALHIPALPCRMIVQPLVDTTKLRHTVCGISRYSGCSGPCRAGVNFILLAELIEQAGANSLRPPSVVASAVTLRNVAYKVPACLCTLGTATGLVN